MSTAVLKPPSLGRAIASLARREIRNVLRVPANYAPALFIPLFFYFIQSSQLRGLFQQSGFGNIEGFVLPVSLLFATANDAAGLSLVSDIERGYFDKIQVAPLNRFSILFGAMSANVVRVFFQASLVTGVALATGMEMETGPLGALGLVALATLWGVAYAGFGLGIALKTANAQATQASFIIIFPFLFLTSTFGPLESITGWFKTAATFNPITYLLDGMRAFTWTGDLADVGKALIAIGGVAALTLTFSFRALLSRTD